MSATGVAQRRGFAVVVLLAAVALAAWLIQARLDTGATTPTAADAAVAEPAAVDGGQPAEGGGGGEGGGAATAETDPSAAAPADGGAEYGAAEGTEAGGEGGAAPVGNPTNSLKAIKAKAMGDAVVDQGGWVLYRFDKDTNNPPASNCTGDCATAWPPVLAGQDQLDLTGIDPSIVGTVDRPDGGKQVTIKGWPVYRYAADPGPGKWKGQGKGGTWFVIKPDGTKNLSCLPAGTPTG